MRYRLIKSTTCAGDPGLGGGGEAGVPRNGRQPPPRHQSPQPSHQPATFQVRYISTKISVISYLLCPFKPLSVDDFVAILTLVSR